MLKREWKRFKKAHGLQSKTLRADYKADGLGVRNKELSFLTETRFQAAWSIAADAARYGYADDVPDVRWRAHVALWAAERGLQLEGDFVECGVYTGLLSLTICHALGFEKENRAFYLFDTFEGIPLEGLNNEERESAAFLNRTMYRDVYEETSRHFAAFPTVKLIRGMLPGTLDEAPLGKIAYLSIDLNNAIGERACIERLWPRLVSGAFVVIDDYAFKGHRAQFDMWNTFSAENRAPVLTLPTGQGLMVKP